VVKNVADSCLFLAAMIVWLKEMVTVDPFGVCHEPTCDCGQPPCLTLPATGTRPCAQQSRLNGRFAREAGWAGYAARPTR
jgi:hypothetical protein